jgi:hypothetical protein
MQGDKLPAPHCSGRTPEPDYVKLADGCLMPIIGYGTFQLKDADMVKYVMHTQLYTHTHTHTRTHNFYFFAGRPSRWATAI